MPDKAKLLAVFLGWLFLSVPAAGQAADRREEAAGLAKKAVRHVDAGNYEEGIRLLEQAASLDPGSPDYLYEIAFTHHKSSQAAKAVKIALKLLERKDAKPEYYRFLGSVYDGSGDKIRAGEVYTEGLKRFPDAGPLFCEQGLLEERSQNPGRAIEYWEEGIRRDPAFASNYYQAAKHYSRTEEKIWALIYGELFINLERNTRRTAEISRLVYDTYLSALRLSSTTVDINLFRNVALRRSGENGPSGTPFEFAYAGALGTGMASAGLENAISLKSLNAFRKGFIDAWEQKKYFEEYPNILFEWHRELRDHGFLDGYNYWILMKGSQEEFNTWKTDNRQSYEPFVKWFSRNPLPVKPGRQFYRTQYQTTSGAPR